jgi:serine phosphatase RsbU (regulator of sigma subunit)
MQNESQPTRTPQPTVLPPLPGVDLYARYHSTRTGGDFFDAVVVGPHMVFLLTDIAGERDEAHTIAAGVQDILRSQAPQLFGIDGINLMDTLAALTHEINLAIYNAAGGSRLAPTFVGCFDLSLGLLAYINAGGPSPVLSDSDGTRTLGHVTVPLGLFTHMTYEPAIQALEPGARLLLVTKGILESRQGRTDFGEERVINIVEEHILGSAPELSQTILDQAHDFRKLPWYSLQNLPFTKPERGEDLTAVALVRPLDTTTKLSS